MNQHIHARMKVVELAEEFGNRLNHTIAGARLFNKVAPRS